MSSRYWLARLSVALQTMALLLVAAFEERSMLGRAIGASGPIGTLVMLGALMCCLVGVIDVVVNDLMPPRYTLPLVGYHRHLGFMGISIALSAIGVLVVFEFGYTPALYTLWLNSALAVGVAFLDVFARRMAA